MNPEGQCVWICVVARGVLRLDDNINTTSSRKGNCHAAIALIDEGLWSLKIPKGLLRATSFNSHSPSLQFWIYHCVVVGYFKRWGVIISEDWRALHRLSKLFQIYVKPARLLLALSAHNAANRIDRTWVCSLERITEGLPLRFLTTISLRLSSLFNLGFTVVYVCIAIDSVLNKRLYGMIRAFTVIFFLIIDSV